MKPYSYSIPIGLVLAAFCARGQGIFVYDQQNTVQDPNGIPAASLQDAQPLGQSITPSFDSVGFIQFNFSDNDPHSPSHTNGTTIYVNLRSDSITGSILASTDPVFLSPKYGFVHPVFLFSSPVAVTPGVTYYFQPVIQSGDIWDIMGAEALYPGGTVYTYGQSWPGWDLWFQEGIVVPEPSSALLFLFGAGFLAWCRRRRART